MGGRNVKNTMLQRLLRVIAPDLCYLCGKNGHNFCEYCKYDIAHEVASSCFWCGVVSQHGVCSQHNENITMVFAAAEYSGGVKLALSDFKFKRGLFLGVDLAQLVYDRLPYLPSDTIVVPVPSTRKSIRQRGYSQTEVIARALAQMSGLHFKSGARKLTGQAQKQLSSRRERQQQVQGVFDLSGLLIDVRRPVLIIDDVVTTGSTVNEFARALRQLGVVTIFAAVVARTP